MSGGQERLDPQRLALFGQGTIGEAARVFCDQRQRTPKVAARVGEVRVLQQLDLGQRVRPARLGYGVRLARHRVMSGGRRRWRECRELGVEAGLLANGDGERARARRKGRGRSVSRPTAERGDRTGRAGED